ncbi:hypothetical protein FRC15_003310 [Serendipita sp. 397]|nr:hypothetical protein FRC15_003310 [Serendipita sp. 397]
MQDSGVWKRKHQRINSGGSQNGDKIITEEEAREFLRDLIPLKPEEETIRRTTSNSSDGPSVARSGSSRMNGSARYGNKGGPEPSQAAVPSTIPNASRLRNSSIREGLDSRATSRSRHIYGNGTMTSTAMSIYHTASSSLVDSGPPTPLRRGRDGNFVNGGAFWDPEVEQAIASNSAEIVGEGEVVLDSGYRSKDKATEGGDPSGGHGQLLDVPDDSPDPSTGRRRLFSSNSDSSVQTITPSRMQSDLATASDSTAQENTDVGKQISSYKPFSGPALFFASAKTGEGLSAVFEYIGERVSKKWEWEESRLHMLEGGGGPGTSGNGDSRIILREVRDNDAGREGGKKDWACC